MPSPYNSWYTLRVPASSANLGPGFDALGLALGVYLTCRFRRSETLLISADGRDAASIPTTPDNMIWPRRRPRSPDENASHRAARP
jgi:homoserine kinase